MTLQYDTHHTTVQSFILQCYKQIGGETADSAAASHHDSWTAAGLADSNALIPKAHMQWSQVAAQCCGSFNATSSHAALTQCLQLHHISTVLLCLSVCQRAHQGTNMVQLQETLATLEPKILYWGCGMTLHYCTDGIYADVHVADPVQNVLSAGNEKQDTMQLQYM